MASKLSPLDEKIVENLDEIQEASRYGAELDAIHTQLKNVEGVSALFTQEVPNVDNYIMILRSKLAIKFDDRYDRSIIESIVAIPSVVNSVDYI